MANYEVALATVEKMNALDWERQGGWGAGVGSAQ